MMSWHSIGRRCQATLPSALLAACLLSTNLVLAAPESTAPTTPAAEVTPVPVPVTVTPPPPSPTPQVVPAGQVVASRTPTASAAPTTSAATAAVGSASSLSQVAMVLMLVVGTIAAIAWLLRRLGMARTAGGSTIRVVSGVTLSNRERILVVEIADQWIVVGVTAASINTLATMPRQESAAGSPGMATPGGKNFAVWLRQTIDKRNRAAMATVGKVEGNDGSRNGNINGK